MLGPRTIKNQPNTLRKTTLKTMPQLGWILESTWICFGGDLGAKLEPKIMNIRPQRHAEGDHVFDWLWD